MNLRIPFRLAALWLGALLFSVAACDNNDDKMVTATYGLSGTASGAAERPDPVSTTASASLSGNYNADTKVLSYSISWNGLSEAPIAMHFHGPAGVNEVAPPVVGIPVPSGAGTTGSVSGTATLTGDQETGLLAGQWYYNLHTPAHTGGEIRGQVTASR